MKHNWTFNEFDDKAADELSSFLPDTIFDIHAHLYRLADLNLPESSVWSEGPSIVSASVWSENISKFLKGKDLNGALFLPAPSRGVNMQMANRFLIDEVSKVNTARGLVMVSPGDSPEELSELLNQPGIIGMKPYHFFSSESPTFESSISGFFPEWQIELGNSFRSVVMLHIVKNRGISDHDNINEINRICRNYPDIKIILAHAARSFHAPNAKYGVKMLRGINNLWFDTSGICEPDPIKAILNEFGPQKLMWGSDFPISELRGRCITLGDGFSWIDQNSFNSGNLKFANPLLVGIESLRALKCAAEDFCLNKEDLINIFSQNARRLVYNEVTERGFTQNLYLHAKERIPGGVQLLSKRPENMAPGLWPAYFCEARGCEVWDLDGKHYYDMVSNGIGACLLGFSDPDVNSAVHRRINLGNMSSLNPPEEVELADLLCTIHPWAEQTRFVRGGGEACAVAVRIARATTDRSIIAVCGYHGWHDWYLAANLGESDALRGHLLPGLDPLGVPVELRGTTVTFKYNDIQNFRTIIDLYGSRLAAVIMEPCRNSDPDAGFLELVRKETHRCGALLIFDEITIGWRLNYGGAHLRSAVMPDIAVFAKALGNGFPIGAVIGTKAAMEGANASFISSTYWTESIGPVAAVATLRKMKNLNIPEHVSSIGGLIMQSWSRLGEKHGLPVVTGGYPALAHFTFQHHDLDVLKTVYTQMMLGKGFLAGLSIYPTMAHTNEIAELYENAIDEVFGEIANGLRKGPAHKLLKGKIALNGFARLT
jgi:glutamate-1-semialdehyde 2,1-aminomutase